MVGLTLNRVLKEECCDLSLSFQSASTAGSALRSDFLFNRLRGSLTLCLSFLSFFRLFPYSSLHSAVLPALLSFLAESEVELSLASILRSFFKFHLAPLGGRAPVSSSCLSRRPLAFSFPQLL